MNIGFVNGRLYREAGIDKRADHIPVIGTAGDPHRVNPVQMVRGGNDQDTPPLPMEKIQYCPKRAAHIFRPVGDKIL